MRNKFSTIMAMAVVGLLAFGGSLGCDVKKTEEGRMPDVDLPKYDVQKVEEGNVDAGKLPEYEVDAPSIDVDTKPLTIPVPDIDIHPAGSPEDNRQDAIDKQEDAIEDAQDEAEEQADEAADRANDAVQ